MKIIATSDWHIGQSFHGIDRTDEHRHFFRWFIDRLQEHQPAAVLIAGDIFDTANPSAQAQALFYDFLVSAHKAVPEAMFIITSGNHDSAARLEAPAPLMHSHNIIVRGTLPRRPSPDDNSRSEIDLDRLLIPVTDSAGERIIVATLPFVRPDQLSGTYSEGVRGLMDSLVAHGRQAHPESPIIMMAHMYANGAEIAADDHSERIIIGGQEEVNLKDWKNAPDYFTCGHIHKRQRINYLNYARYTGSILPMSFAEVDYKHSVDLIEIEREHAPHVTHLEYEPQHRLMILSSDNMSAAKFKKEILKALPARAEDSPPSCRSYYVALQIDMDNISADKRREIEDLVASRDAVLCVVRPIKRVIAPDPLTAAQSIISIDNIINRPAIDTLREAFMSRHGQMPDDEVLSMMNDVISSITVDYEVN